MGKKSVIIIDEDIVARESIEREFREKGFTVENFDDGEKGFSRALVAIPDLIITELILPAIDGITLCKRLKETQRTSHCKVIIYSSLYLEDESLNEPIEVPADMVLKKPMEPSEIVNISINLLEGKIAQFNSIHKDRILVVDDDETTLRLLSLRLKSVGIDVATAADGETGWETFLMFKPHLCLIDVRLPGLSGIDLLNRIHSHSALLPVILMTAYGNEAVAVEALKGEASDYLTKPFDFVPVMKRIEFHLERSKLERAKNVLTERLRSLTHHLISRLSSLENQVKAMDETHRRLIDMTEGVQIFANEQERLVGEPQKALLANIISKKQSNANELYRIWRSQSNLLYELRLKTGKLSSREIGIQYIPALLHSIERVRFIFANIDYTVNVPQKAKWEVWGDLVWIYEILSNCLLPVTEKGHIEINAESRENEVVTTITHYGIEFSNPGWALLSHSGEVPPLPLQVSKALTQWMGGSLDIKELKEGIQLAIHLKKTSLE